MKNIAQRTLVGNMKRAGGEVIKSAIAEGTTEAAQQILGDIYTYTGKDLLSSEITGDTELSVELN